MVTGQTGWDDRSDWYLAEPAQNQSFSPPRVLTQIQLGLKLLQVISSIFQVPAHTETTQPSRSKRKHKVVAREMSKEANHKETQEFNSRSSDSSK